MALRKPILETGNLKHLMILDLVAYIILAFLTASFCFIKGRYLRQLVQKQSKDASQHALIFITGLSIFANTLLRIGACITYMGIQYSSLTATSPNVDNWLMLPLYFETFGFIMFFCTFSLLIFSWWHIVGGMKRSISDYSVLKINAFAAGIILIIFPLFIPCMAIMPVRWNSDGMFIGWMASTFVPIAICTIAIASFVAYLGYKMVKQAQMVSKTSHVGAKRLVVIASAFSISLLARLIGLPFIAASAGTEDLNYNVSQIMFILLPDIIPSALYLYVHARAHYQNVKPKSPAPTAQNVGSTSDVVKSPSVSSESKKTTPSEDVNGANHV